MASGIPTRRTTRLRADENSKPTLATRTKSSTMVQTVAAGKPVITAASNAVSGVPLTKRQPVMRRAALGEVTNAGAAKSKSAADGKEIKQEISRPLPIRRSTRTSLAAAVEVPAPVLKRKASEAVKPKAEVSRVPKPTRQLQAPTRQLQAPSVGASKPKPVAVEATIAVEVAVEVEPAAKRRRTSTPPVKATELDVLSDDEEDAIVLKPSAARPKDFGWVDLDEEDAGDPIMVSEYVVDVFEYMMELETSTMPNPQYMSMQAELQWKMRSVLMDWLIEVHCKFRLLPETLFIASNLIDRFLSARVVSLVKLQLVGLTALFVAAKYEEVICPSVSNFLYMADGGYEDDEILKAERYMLQTVDFNLSYPNPIHFLRRVSKADSYDVQTRTIGKYLMEISCVDHHLLHIAPSLLAAAGVWLARLILDRGAWDANLVHYSCYSEEEIVPAAQLMVDFLLSPGFYDHAQFQKKYASRKYMKASVFCRNWAVDVWPDAEAATYHEGGDVRRGRELCLFTDVELYERLCKHQAEDSSK